MAPPTRTAVMFFAAQFLLVGLCTAALLLT